MMMMKVDGHRLEQTLDRCAGRWEHRRTVLDALSCDTETNAARLGQLSNDRKERSA